MEWPARFDCRDRCRTVKALRGASPARRAADGLDGPFAIPGWATTAGHQTDTRCQTPGSSESSSPAAAPIPAPNPPNTSAPRGRPPPQSDAQYTVPTTAPPAPPTMAPIRTARRLEIRGALADGPCAKGGGANKVNATGLLRDAKGSGFQVRRRVPGAIPTAALSCSESSPGRSCATAGTPTARANAANSKLSRHMTPSSTSRKAVADSRNGPAIQSDATGQNCGWLCHIGHVILWQRARPKRHERRELLTTTSHGVTLELFHRLRPAAASRGPARS